MLFRSLRASAAFTVFVVCVAVFADVLLQNLIVPVLPYALRGRVGLTGEEDVQKWQSILLSAFSATFMGGSFFLGSIVDRISTRRTPFVLSLLVTFASTLSFALATTLPILLIARLLEGLATAIVTTVGNALICDVVGQERLGRAMGFSTMAISIGLLVGPALGGVLYEYCGYFETFLPALVLVGVEVGLRCLVVEGKKGSSTAGTVESGDVESTVESRYEDGNDWMAAEEIGNHADPQNATDTESQPLLQSSPQSLTHPRRNAHLVLLGNPRFLTSLLGVFILNSTACGFDAVLGPYISATFNLGATHVAGLFLALAIPQLLLSLLTGVLTDRYGPKMMAIVGLAIGTLSLASLSLFSQATTHPVPKLHVAFFCLGTALALALVPLRVDAAAAVEVLQKDRPGIFGPTGAQGTGFGLINSVVAAGGLAGPLGAGWLRIRIHWAGMAWVMSGLSLGVLGLVLGFTGKGSICNPFVFCTRFAAKSVGPRMAVGSGFGQGFKP